DILGELTEDRSAEILHRLDREEAEDVEELPAYPEDTAGGLMTTEVLQVSEAATAGRCLDLVRAQQSDTAVAFYVIVVDEDEHLRGMVSLQQLLQADPDAGVADLMSKDVVTVQVDDHAEEVAAVLAKYNLVAVPVIDQEFRLQGIVTVDDALDAVLPEAVKRKLPRTL
ncbi:MAG: CBS domain-containing protein, partial [bacterium]|nr:CBS domain-containing protein [bacterium]